ncbi:hypothetical protein ACRPH4_19485 [Pantoea allii]
MIAYLRRGRPNASGEIAALTHFNGAKGGCFADVHDLTAKTLD